MALSFGSIEKHNAGDLMIHKVAVTFDSSYPAGGEPITVANLGFRNSIVHIFDGTARKPGTPDLAVEVTYDSANGTLIAFWGDDNNAADAPETEVADTTSLASYVLELVALGK